MDRYSKRLNETMKRLTAAGYAPRFVQGEDESVDDCIDLGDDVSVQICSTSGDAVAACKILFDGPSPVFSQFPINDDDELLPQVTKAFAVKVDNFPNYPKNPPLA